MRVRFLIPVLALFASVEAMGGVQIEQNTFEAVVDPTGSVWVTNPYGSIDVVGTDSNKVEITIQRIINANDDQAIKDAKEALVTVFGGDTRVRTVKTIFPEPRDPRWTAIVNYSVRVPRMAHVTLQGRAMDHIRVSQLGGDLSITAFSGTIILSGLTGSSMINTVNGHVIYDYPDKPTANARVQAVNANIDIYAPRDAIFEWVGETINGDLFTTFNPRGLFSGNVYRAHVNENGGPTLTTSTLSGRVLLLAKGTSPAQAHRIAAVVANGPTLPPVRKIERPIIYANWQFSANVADVNVGEIRGATRIETGAGEVDLDRVLGSCYVNSHGGPLNLGDIIGPLDAHTDAGDVTVRRAARQGGSVSTDGGIVRVAYAGGPITLRSGGGDIIVGQAVGSVEASTRSGDINITMSPLIKTQRVTAKTSQGNVTLVLSPNFAADIDALLTTDDADANVINSDFNLTLRRSAFNGKTRIHATGKINGGGERVELMAEDGSINISSQVITPMVIPSPQP